MDWNEASMMLEAHLGYEYKYPSAFSSWHISLLSVLVHGVRKMLALGDTNVRVYVLDTAKITGSARVYRAADLMKLFGLEGCGCLPHITRYAVGECLVYGPLERGEAYEKCFSSSLVESLIDSKLFGSVPALQRVLDAEDNRLKCQRLHQRVHQLRHGYFFIHKEKKKHTRLPNQRTPDDAAFYANLARMCLEAREGKSVISGKDIWHLPRDRVQRLRNLGHWFGERFELTMTFAFASLMRRDVSPAALEGVIIELDGLPYRPISKASNEDNIHDEFEERKQFLRMLHVFGDIQSG